MRKRGKEDQRDAGWSGEDWEEQRKDVVEGPVEIAMRFQGEEREADAVKLW